MLQLTGARGTLSLLNSGLCTHSRAWSRHLFTRAAPLLQSIPSCYGLEPGATSTSLVHGLEAGTTSTSLVHGRAIPHGCSTPLPGRGKARNLYTEISSPSLLCLRQFTTSASSLVNVDDKLKPASPVDLGYVPVYKFKYIVHVYTLCRFKLFQTALVVSLVPLFLCLGLSANFGQLCGLITTASFAGFMLCVMGEVARKFVGRVYYHPDQETVCVSHLSFWGNRKDDIFELKDVVPMSDTEPNFDDIYLKMRLYSDPSKSFLISFRMGEILHDDYFYDVFGCLPK